MNRKSSTHLLAQRAGEADGLENHADVSPARMDVQSDGNNLKTAKNVSRKVNAIEFMKKDPTQMRWWVMSQQNTAQTGHRREVTVFIVRGKTCSPPGGE